MASPVPRRPTFAAEILRSYRQAGSVFEIANDNRRRRPASAASSPKKRRLRVVMRALVGVVRLAIRQCRGPASN